MTHTLYHGDCLDILPTLPAQSVDCICADPPYGTTACKWDSVIPLDAMWRELKRVIKPRGAVVLFAAQPFTSALVMSNAGWFKYIWTWDKGQSTNFQQANNKPLSRTEDIAIFGPSGVTYNPQMTKRDKPLDKRKWKADKTKLNSRVNPLDSKIDTTKRLIEFSFPHNILAFSSVAAECNNPKRVHPTQKPVELLRYLVRTYTNPGETVLDFTMGSGTCGVACAMEGREFIGVELDAGYFDIARKRIESVQPALMEAAD